MQKTHKMWPSKHHLSSSETRIDSSDTLHAKSTPIKKRNLMKVQTSFLKISRPQRRAKNKVISMSGKPCRYRTDRITAPLQYQALCGSGSVTVEKARRWVIGCLMNCIGRPCSVEGWVCHRALGSHSRVGFYWLSLCFCGRSFTPTDAAGQPCGRMETFSWAH